MTNLKLAHIREQGQDIIIIPLDDNFGRKANAEQHRVSQALQLRARSAGLAGTVVIVWNAGGTGSWLFPACVRLVPTLQQSGQDSELHLADFDIVEQKTYSDRISVLLNWDYLRPKP